MKSLATDPIVAPDPAWGALGAVVFALSIPMLWSGLHIRGKTYSRLKASVDLAHEGPAERIIEELRTLRAEIDLILPGGRFDPYSVIADPSTVGPPARRSIKIMTERHRLRSRFQRLLRVCSILKYSGIAFTAMTTAALLTYFFFTSNLALWQLLSWVTLAVGVVGVIMIASYTVLDAKIQSAIEHSSEGGVTTHDEI